jgi:putative FmdB family regulatory protein
MPTYRYECSQCGETIERVQSMTAEPLSDCPDESCGGQGTLERLLGSGGGLIFKGSGFYATDYKKKSESSGSKEKTESTPKPSGEAATTCEAASSSKSPAKD